MTKAAPVEGDLRLVDRVDINGFATGALQVFVDGAFGAVCSSRFSHEEAGVACRQMGFVSGRAIRDAPFVLDSRNPRRTSPVNRDALREVAAPFVLGEVQCDGTEERLVDCSAPARPREDFLVQGCEPFTDTYAGVSCGGLAGVEEGGVRLTGGLAAPDGSAVSGRLEVFFGGGWGPVCSHAADDDYDFEPFLPPAAAGVACRQLGFAHSFAMQPVPRPIPRDVERRVPVWLAAPQCTGSEAALAACPGTELDPNLDLVCSHLSDAWIVCHNEPASGVAGTARLAGGEAGPDWAYGRLEVARWGLWGNVCSMRGFTEASAAVSCTELGYGLGIPLSTEALRANLPVALASVACSGNETALAACPSDDSAIPQCASGRALPPELPPFTLGTTLACATAAGSCPAPGPPAEGDLRLVGGSGTPCDALHSGVVEIFHSASFGGLCGARLGDEAVAGVVCRQLGFLRGSLADSAAAQDGDNGADDAEDIPTALFWMDVPECRGFEAHVLRCTHLFRAARGPCRSRPLRVACRNFTIAAAGEAGPDPAAEEGDVRLVEQKRVANWVQGGLEIFAGGAWARVACSGAFTGADANVACRQLGHGRGTVALSAVDDGFLLQDDPPHCPRGTPQVMLPLGCNGTEAAVLDCSGAEDMPRGRDSFCDAGLVLACVVEEQEGEEEGALRLVGGETREHSGFGVLEIFHAGAWGMFCDDLAFNPYYFDPDFTLGAADVACRQLGYEAGVWHNLLLIPPAFPISPPWLTALDCDGSEAAVLDCQRPPYADTVGCGLPQRLFCTSTAEELEGSVRLVGGATDPGNAWAYGRPQVFHSGAYSTLINRFSFSLPRNSSQVVCRSLGFAAGGGVISSHEDNSASALPGHPGETKFVDFVRCNGDEADVSQCAVGVDPAALNSEEDAGSGGRFDVGVVCINPSGCNVTRRSPRQGDVRLVPLQGTVTATSPCDAAHLGGVELFNRGRWGRLGVHRNDFLTAQVVCRQLGFPFWSLYATGSGDPTPARPGTPRALVWASRVTCTGRESRLTDCEFPAGVLGSASVPDPATVGARFDRRDTSHFGVMCRRFEITESDYIRR